jgi:ATP-dependent DNA helicase RecG
MNILDILQQGEGQFIEFKENFNSSLGKEICAFANSYGGKIYLGISDNGKIRGIKLTNSIKSQIQDISRNMDPSFQVNIEQIEEIIVIFVPEGKEKPYQVNGEFYLRQGANSQKLKRNEVREIFQKENHISFEKQIPNFDLKKEFNKSQFEDFRNKAKIPTKSSVNHVLQNLGLLTENKPNNACALLFSKKVTNFFLSGDISCVLYQGTSKLNMLDKKVFDSDFISNFENTVLFILRNIKTKAEIIDMRRIETPEIPENALREAILNAMIHKDYFIEGRILVEIFSDRIEIGNPGRLLFDKKELGKISMLRNPIITDCMLRANYVEKIGSGINRIKELVSDVKFEISSNWFRIIFLRDVKPKQIGHKSDTNVDTNVDTKPLMRQNWIISYLKDNKQIKSKLIQSKFNVSREIAYRDLNNLIKKDKIVKKGAGNNVWYELR